MLPDADCLVHFTHGSRTTLCSRRAPTGSRACAGESGGESVGKRAPAGVDETWRSGQPLLGVLPIPAFAPQTPDQKLIGCRLAWPLLTIPQGVWGGEKPLPRLPRGPNPRRLKVTFLDFSGRPTGLYYSICTQSGGQSGCRPHATAGEAGGVEWCGVGLSSLEIGGNEGLLRKDHRGRPGISWVLGPVPFCRQCLWPIAL